jgi:hypothetical protein
MHPFRHPRWPQIRALLIALHVASLVVLSLPTRDAIGTSRQWHTPNARADLQQAVERLRRFGIDTDEQRLGASLRSAANAYLNVYEPLSWPFRRYAEWSGCRQGWRMFARPQRHPAELHVDVEVDGHWQPLYRPHSDEYAWNREQFEHNRFRKFLGRFARGFVQKDYDEAANFIGHEALDDHPEANRARVQLYRYASLPPARVRAGEAPLGHYRNVRIVRAEAGK